MIEKLRGAVKLLESVSDSPRLYFSRREYDRASQCHGLKDERTFHGLNVPELQVLSFTHTTINYLSSLISGVEVMSK
jgi:hypothetical protein